MKLASHLAAPLRHGEVLAPFVRLLPTAPLHALFTQARERTPDVA
ncbi:hypothetical protein ACFW2T_01020 [Streptomyces sp. NPDC058892]